MPWKRRHVTFNLDFPKVEDFAYRNDALSAQLMQRFSLITQSLGVLAGYGSEMEVTDVDGASVEVADGIAFLLGESAQIEVAERGAISAAEDVVVHLQYAQVADTDPDAVRVSGGTPHTVWYTDGYILGKTDYAVWIAAPPTNKVPLARVIEAAGALTIIDMRPWLTLGIPLPDASVTTAKIANAAVTNPKIANLAVNAAKLAENAVTEIKLAPGTDQVALLQDIQTEPDLGESVDPATKVVYYCDQGGGYEYKIFGRTLRMLGSAKGPIRRLRLVADIEASGVGDGEIYLVAWLNGVEPGSYDPGDPGYDGLVAHDGLYGPVTYDVKLELDVSGLGTSDDRIAYGVVMRNNTSGTLLMYKVTLVGIR